MRYYSRLQRIKDTKKRNLLYRKIVRVAVVPIIFSLAILFYLSMVSENLEQVDQKEKTASHFAPDGASPGTVRYLASRDKEVAGEKTQQITTAPEKSAQKNSIAPTVKPTQTYQQSAFSPTPSNQQIAAKEEQTIPKATTDPTSQPTPTADPLLIQLPEELKETSGTFPIFKGELSFKVIADWGEADRHLVWGNFNGRDIKNLFQIVGSSNILVSDIHGEDGNVINDECNVYFDEFAYGREYRIKVAWDFQTEPFTLKIYINDSLKRECASIVKPSDNGGKIFIGSITNFLF